MPICNPSSTAGISTTNDGRVRHKRPSKSPVAPHQQTPNPARRQRLVRRRLPGDSPHTIEANQSKLSAQPEITVGSLGNGVYRAPGKTVADFPRGMGVLADVQRRIQRERARGHRQQQTCENSAQVPCDAHLLMLYLPLGVQFRIGHFSQAQGDQCLDEKNDFFDAPESESRYSDSPKPRQSILERPRRRQIKSPRIGDSYITRLRDCYR